MPGVMNQPLAQDPMAGQVYPSTDEEKDMIVEQVITMIHSDEVKQGIKDALINAQPDKVVEIISSLAVSMVTNVVGAIEEQTQRDISPQAELGIVAMSVEEMMTIGTQFGLKATEEMVGNTVQIASNKYNASVGGR